MAIVERHSSPDGWLTLVVDLAEDGDWSVGFNGYAWHTHGDLLTHTYGGTPASAVRAFVDDVLASRRVIVISWIGKTIRAVWITEDPSKDERKYAAPDETIEKRYWNGEAVPEFDPRAIGSLHNAVRQFCVSRQAEWGRRYAELSAANRERMALPTGGWTYSDEAYDLFPRSQILGAIRDEVEQFLPSDFHSVEEARSLLSLAGQTAQTKPKSYGNPTATRAVEEERRTFISFVETVDAAKLGDQPRLPFRRVLGCAEQRQLSDALTGRWGRWSGGCAYPDNPPSAVITLHIKAMDTPDAYRCLCQALRARGLNRVLELREFGDGYELDLDLVEFTYNGAEGFWTSRDLSWMVYASHESSITFGSSWLIDEMRKCLPDFDRYIYRGWELSAYDPPAKE